jgi:hypothetical protein
MAVRLSALRAGRPLSPRIFLVLIFVKSLSRPQGHSAAGRITSTEKSNDLIGIEPVPFRLVAQCLNQLRYRVPRLLNIINNKNTTKKMVLNTTGRTDVQQNLR